MFSFNGQRGGFATIAIVGGVAVAVVAGGVFYFLRSSPPEVDTVLKDDSAAVFSEETVLSVDAEEALLRSLPRGRTDDYCSLLGLEREACADGAEAVCRDLFGSCSIDAVSRDSSDTIRQFAEACLVLRTEEGRSQYFAWLDSGDPKPFPLYYAIFGLSSDTFSQKRLSDAYQELLNSYFSGSSCDTSEALRLLAEGYLTLGITEGRAMYDEWLQDTGGNPFPLYYAVFGLRRGSFTQQQLTDVYKKLLGQYFSGYYGNNIEVLRLLMEAYLALRESSSSSAYNSFLDGGLSSSLSDVSFDLDGDGLVSFLSDLDLSSDNLAIVLSGLSLSPGNLGAVLGGLNLSSGNLGAALGSLNLSPASLGTVLGSLDLSPVNLGAVLGSLDLSSEDFGALLGTLDLSPDNLSTALSGISVSPDNLGAALGSLSLSTDNLSAVLSNLRLPTDDLSSVLSNLRIPADDLSIVLSNIRLSTDDLSAVLSNLRLSTDDLRTVLSGLTIPPIEIQILSTDFDIPFPGGGDPFSGVTVPPGDDSDDLPDDTDALPAVAISPVPEQIGLLNTAVQPSFRLEITKGGSLYTPDVPITVALECEDVVQPSTQQTSSLIVPGALPESILLSASEGTTGDLVRNPDVTGYVRCTVVADTAADPTYRLGFPSSAAVTIVGGSSTVLCDRSPCDPTGDPLPAVSIAAVEPSVGSGRPAVFRVSSSPDIIGQLHVRYSCSARHVAGTYLGEKEITIQSGSGGFTADITLPTAANVSDTVTCEVLDGKRSLYRISGRTASVGVGLLGPEGVGDRDPALPTVSLIAYRTAEEKEGGTTFVRSRSVSSALVGADDVYFGFVIDDPQADSFGAGNSDFPRVSVSTDALYVLYETDFGSTISVFPDPEVAGAIKIGILGPSDILSDENLSSSDLPALLQSRPSGYSAHSPRSSLWRYPGGGRDFDSNGVSIQLRPDNRVVMRNNVAEETTICGYDDSSSRTLHCERYETAGDFTPTAIRVTAQCYRDFSDSEIDSEVSAFLIGGRYYDRSERGYAKKVSSYIAGDDDPQGVLYEFISPGGEYVSVAEGSEGVSSSADINPFLDPDTTFSCEISGGGTEDEFTVLSRRASVRVYSRPVVSIESGGLESVEDVSSIGIPAATIPYGERTTGFTDITSPFSTPLGLTTESPDEGASFGDVLTNLGAAVGVGFLTSFGSCVGAGLLNDGLSSLKNVSVFGSVKVDDETQAVKECSLDGAASAAVMEVLTAITRDYIVWAHEGFEDKPLFVRNPTTFYKNFHDDAIGRVIDRSGLGFLCDIGVPNFDAYRATLKVNLQQRYQGIAADRPRCTYSDLTNNLEEFYDDARSLVTDFDLNYLQKHGFVFDIDGTATTQFAGNVLLSPKSDAGNQLDALSAKIDRAMKKTERGSNFLLATSKMDSEVREAEQDFDAAAKPPPQFFNPNDPTSVAAFKACSEAENPEGDVDCFLLNASGSRLTNALGKATDGHFDRLLQVDEFGEIGQLAKLAVNATSAGLMKKYLRNGFGVTVGRETADILTGISDSFAATSTPYGVNRVDLSGTWWSAFFQDNGVYKALLGAEMYEKDIHTLYDYIGKSFYEDPKRDGTAIPPVTPYTAFATVVNSSNVKGGYPSNAYTSHKDVTESIVNRAYVGVYESKDVADNFNEKDYKDFISGEEGWLEHYGHGILWFVSPFAAASLDLLQHGEPRYPWHQDAGVSWVNNNLTRVFGGGNSYWKDGEYAAYDALRRFNQVYPFMRYYDNRVQYNSFVERVERNDFSIEVPYKYSGGSWTKNIRVKLAELDIPSLFFPLKDGVESIAQGAQYPVHYDQIKGALFSSVTSERLVDGVMRPVGSPCPPSQCIDPGDRDRVCRDGRIVGATISPETVGEQCTGNGCSQAGERLEFVCDGATKTATSPGLCVIKTQACGRFGKEIRANCLKDALEPRLGLEGISVDFVRYVSPETVSKPVCLVTKARVIQEDGSAVFLTKGNQVVRCKTGDSADTCFAFDCDIGDSANNCEFTLQGSYYRERQGDVNRADDDRNDDVNNERERVSVSHRLDSCFGDFSRPIGSNRVIAGTLSFKAEVSEKVSAEKPAKCVISTPPSEVSTVAQTYGNLQSVEAMREMYEATILAHITLVGQVDEYISGRAVDDAVYKYRERILANSEYASPFERWKLVQDATLKKFRDGTMTVYVPIDNRGDGSQYGSICKVDGEPEDDVVVYHPSFTRRYRETECILGTVFQDQAYFIIRRDNSGHPDLLEQPLTVRLACGYDTVSPSSDGPRYSIEKPVESDTVTLYPNQPVELYTAPIASDLFDSDAFAEGRFGRVRCSIAGAAYGIDVPIKDLVDDKQLIDEDMLTATVTVSEHKRGETLHGRMEDVLQNPDAKGRIDKIGAALYYTYLLGWSTGFIQMPYFSAQDLLSALPYTVPGNEGKSVLQAVNNQERLRQYRLLASLFVDEADDRFDTEHFGFLTPTEARDKFENDYGKRFDAYFGRALGSFLQKLPAQYRQR